MVLDGQKVLNRQEDVWLKLSLMGLSIKKEMTLF